LALRSGSFKKFIYILIFFALLVIGAFVLISVRQKNYGKFDDIKQVNEIRISDGSELYNNSGCLFVTGMNGMKGYDGDGGLMMDVAFELDHPFTVSRGKTAAIADIGGNKVYIISPDGLPHSYKTEAPIVKLCTAEDGTTAVLLDDGSKDLIRIYTPDGEPKVEIGTTTANDGFPVDIALSGDGKKLVTLYLSFSGDDIVSKVTFYNTGDVGKNFIENIVGQKIYAGEMAYFVDFMGNDHVAAVFGDGFSLFKMEEIPELLKDERSKFKLFDVQVCDECLAVISEIPDGRKLTFYGTNGAVSGSIDELNDYDSITVTNGEALIIKGQTAVIYRMNGTTKLDCRFEGSGSKLYSGGGNRYFFTDPDRVRAVTLVK
jgi:hypothetical protein